MIAQTAPHISNSDRLGLTLFLAAALHAIVILGISFDLADRLKNEPSPLSLEITLVHSKSDKAPEKADYLAQVDQSGGGDVKEKVRPSSAFANPRPIQTRGNAANSAPASSPAPQPVRKTSKQTLAAKDDSRLKTKLAQPEPTPTLPDTPTASELMQRSLEIARISAEISQRQQIYAQRPRVKTITARTKQYRDALYLKTWQDKVERVGNLNYPQEAKRRKLSGYLTMVVRLKPNGAVQMAKVIRSSGHKVLDDAAVRIVRMASPFAPFSPEMKKEFDILEIVRTWKFESDYRLSTN